MLKLTDILDGYRQIFVDQNVYAVYHTVLAVGQRDTFGKLAKVSLCRFAILTKYPFL